MPTNTLIYLLVFLAATAEDMLGDGHIRKGTTQSDGRGVALAEINAHVESIDERLENVEHALGAVQNSVTKSAERYDALFSGLLHPRQHATQAYTRC